MYNNQNTNDFTANYFTIVKSAAGFSGSFSGGAGSRFDHTVATGTFTNKGGTHTAGVNDAVVNAEYQTVGDLGVGVYYGPYAWPPGTNGLIYQP